MSCENCSLKNKVPVNGEGSKSSSIMIIGEAPGEEEDISHRPFVGRSGKLLNATLAKLGIKREDIYITNVVKCRPPSNRRPHQDEIGNCTGKLAEEIREINPDVIIPLGLSATQWFISDGTMGEMNGRVYEVWVSGTLRRIAPVYHPAAVLRNPNLRESFERGLREAIEEIHKIEVKADK